MKSIIAASMVLVLVSAIKIKDNLQLHAKYDLKGYF
jgi:hypothetical protein